MKMVESYTIEKWKDNEKEVFADLIVVEEPLEIKVLFDVSPFEVNLTLTMRTPGDDLDLVLGFLLNERLIQKETDVSKMIYCAETEELNTIKVYLKEASHFLTNYKKRNFFSSSACGVCGKTSIEDLVANTACDREEIDFKVSQGLIYQLQQSLDQNQLAFKHTGGIHAAALFNANGDLLVVKEDVGRHNAMDKLTGWASKNEVDLKDKLVLFSGRLSYELTQKVIQQNIPMIVSFGAPSSLAIDLAKAFNVVVCGFAKNNRFNVYHGFNAIEN